MNAFKKYVPLLCFIGLIAILMDKCSAKAMGQNHNEKCNKITKSN